jgi:hypothetical protein
MADKPLHLISGTITEKEATVVSAGAGDAGEIPALDAAGKLDPSLMPTGIAADTALIQASENLAAGDLVNLHDVGGAWRARKADASAIGTKAHGFVKAAVTSGQNATVYFEGSNDVLSGLTPGTYFLSETAGAITQTPPTTSAAIVQEVGVSTAATVLNFEVQRSVVRA